MFIFIFNWHFGKVAFHLRPAHTPSSSFCKQPLSISKRSVCVVLFKLLNSIPTGISSCMRSNLTKLRCSLFPLARHWTHTKHKQGPTDCMYAASPLMSSTHTTVCSSWPDPIQAIPNLTRNTLQGNERLPELHGDSASSVNVNILRLSSSPVRRLFNSKISRSDVKSWSLRIVPTSKKVDILICHHQRPLGHRQDSVLFCDWVNRDYSPPL